MNTVKVCVGKTRMVAHRGCSCLETENTLAAFIAAGNRSYYGIETDVRRTVDGKYVLLHDSDTGRVGCDRIEPEKCTLQTLRRITLCDKDRTHTREDLRIPTLSEYIAACARYEKHGFLEIKGDFPVEWMDEIMTEIDALSYASHITIISFHYDSLLHLRVHHPAQPAMFLCHEADEKLLDRLAMDGFGLDIHYAAVNEELVDGCRRRGIALNVWTVDDRAVCEHLAKLGVDYITSNCCE